MFNFFVQAVNKLKTRDTTVTGVIGQSENAGCYHSLVPVLRLGLAGASGEMLVIKQSELKTLWGEENFCRGTHTS